jgi:hypothetical protein
MHHKRDPAVSPSHHRAEQSCHAVEVAEQEAEAGQHPVDHLEGDHLTLREQWKGACNRASLTVPSERLRAVPRRVDWEKVIAHPHRPPF